MDQKIESNSAFPSFQVEFWISPLVTEAISALQGLEVRGSIATISTIVWIPGPIIRAVAPNEVANFFAQNNITLPISVPNLYVPVSITTHSRLSSNSYFLQVLESDFEVVVSVAF